MISTRINEKLEGLTRLPQSMNDSEPITVTMTCTQERDTTGIRIESALLSDSQLGVFADYPWSDGSAMFSAPFVGNWNAPANHTTSISTDVDDHNV